MKLYNAGQTGQTSERYVADEMQAVPGPTRPASAEVPCWNLEDATARLSELVRKARDEGPQRVTVHGRDAVVVVASDQFDSLQAHAAQRSLRHLLVNSPLRDLEFGEGGIDSPIREIDL